MPRPPSRASPIAILASVTVSIAAETIGTSSTIVRVSLVAVETSFGRTLDSAGTSRTSSNVSPSFANFSGSVVRAGSKSSFPTSIGEGYRRLSDERHEPEARPLRPARARRSRTPACSRPAWRGSNRPAPTSSVAAAPAATAARSASSGAAPGMARGDEGRQQHVARADGRHRLDPRRDRAEPAGLTLLAEQRDAAGVGRDRPRCAGPSSAIWSSASRKSSSSWNSWPTSASASRWFGETRNGSASTPEPERLTLGVEHREHMAAREVVDRLGVELVRHVPRQRAGEDDELGSLRQVVELVEQHTELVLASRPGPTR